MVMCDAHIEQLRDKREQWIDCLDGNDVHSIANQLTQMTWNLTAFRVLMEAYDLAPDADEGGKQTNGLLFGLLQESFLASLLLGIRRLMDKERLGGNRGVYSLWSLLKDISEHSHLLTRDAIIRLGPPGENHGQLWLQDWPTIKDSLIDDLTGIAENERTPNDRVPRVVFDSKCDTLSDKFHRVEKLINKEIAHAATPESRGSVNYNGILWSDLYDLHADLCKTAHFLQDLISESGWISFLPVLRGHEFQYLSRSIVSENDLDRLADRWAKLDAEYKSWRDWRTGVTENQRQKVPGTVVAHVRTGESRRREADKGDSAFREPQVSEWSPFSTSRHG
jgi:hypothetical protein